MSTRHLEFKEVGANGEIIHRSERSLPVSVTVLAVEGDTVVGERRVSHDGDDLTGLLHSIITACNELLDEK